MAPSSARPPGREAAPQTEARPQESPLIAPQFIILKVEDGYRWQLFSGRRQLLAVSAYSYPCLDDCRQAVEQVRRCWGAPVNFDSLAEPESV